ncbi:MAG: ABC transporter [Betaproteobacteria bacterium RBG_16_56_24]|nr:MAG: ABC transporter [Betaproteobacteria bacterium RBG_16_56_24]
MVRINLLALLVSSLLVTGCAGARNPDDPLEPLNRGIYRFNDTMDKAIIKPVAKGYNAAMPAFGKTMVSNFFSNLDDVVVTVNDLLQFKFAQAASDGARVLFNTTFGVFGLFNVTQRLEKHNEDFGQTMGYWGAGSGPYLVLPILGPSNFRDGAGLYLDTFPDPMYQIEHIRSRNQVYVGDKINQRAGLLDQEKIMDEAKVDGYEFMRDTYLLHRKSLVYDGNPPRPRYDDE